MGSQKICTKCGKEVSENSNFCATCGELIDKDMKEIKELKECVYCKSKIDKRAQVCPICKKRMPLNLKTRLNFFEVILILFIAWMIFSIIIYPIFRASID